MGAKEEILAGASTGLVDAAVLSKPLFRPRFISNDYKQGRKVISELESELRHCVSFDFSVAFVTMGGITPLLQTLRELEKRGVRGRVLTTDYLSFSDPDALARLAELSNVEVRMFKSTGSSNAVGFHTKGYLFTRADGTRRVLVGSSNLTAKALSVNKEWNLAVTSLENGELLRELSQEFEMLWGAAENLSEVIDTYRQMHDEARRQLKAQPVIRIEQVSLKPNSMQAAFIARLDKVIAAGYERALLVSATGTGKTYASAFAMRHLKARRLLFLAHREQILRQSIKSYERVFGSSHTYGLLSGNAHETDCDFLFATMQTMSKSDVLSGFSQDEFDYIVVDEAHRAGSSSYLKILDYFRPKFCLGMTASPDRTDGFDVYKLFGNQIAYEIRLQQAMEEELLCPFHYFGITDLEVNGQPTDDKTDFKRLVCADRVDYILEQSRYYGYSGSRLKALLFCSRREEGERLAEEFEKRGYAAEFVSGDDSPQRRQDAIDRLVAVPGDPCYENKLDYVITVDIFNEGVDIPQVNQVIMLRPTQSPIVFVQQLGRGLRKAQDKEYVVIIDFIGNYANNYMIPIALSGDRTYNKDGMRKFVMESERTIPGQSSVHFDEIARQRIFDAIDATKVTVTFLKEKYQALKSKLGRVPLMLDFQEFGDVDPMLFVEKKKSFYRFLESYEPEWEGLLSKDEHLMLEYISTYFGNGMRPHELVALMQLVEGKEVTRRELGKSLFEYSVVDLSDESFHSTCGMLEKTFIGNRNSEEAYGSFEIVSVGLEDGEVRLGPSSSLEAMLCNLHFKQALCDVVAFGLARYRDRYIQADHGLVLYEKYTRRDVCRMLNWSKDDSSTIYGYRVKHGTCPIFVTYNKDADISESTRYKDCFESPYVFNWMTRSRLRLDSPEVVKIIQAQQTGLDVRLFIKKSNNEGGDFYYLGRVRPTNPTQVFQRDDDGNKLDIVNFKLELEHPVRDDIYEYFTREVAETALGRVEVA